MAERTPPGDFFRLMGWQCGADRSGVAGNHPEDCDWPFCGCDPYANQVLEAIEESGLVINRRSTDALPEPPA